MDIFERATSTAGLTDAWNKVKENGGCSGGDNVTIAEYGRNLTENIRLLHLSLRENAYSPAPLRHVGVPKKSGGLRRLAIPSVADRIAQTAMAAALAPILEPEFEDCSYGYRPGRSVDMAVRHIDRLRREGFGWVVEGDIERYFDNVPHGLLLEALGKHVDDARALALVSLWLDEYNDGGVGVVQGSPLSPLLANLYLDALDEEFTGRDVRIVRFADDFVVLCKCEKTAGKAYNDVREALAGYGLRLNPDKTRIVRFEDGFRFLGHLFVRSLTMKAEAVPSLPPEAERVMAPSPHLIGDEDGIANETQALGPPADGEEEEGAAVFVRDRTLYVLDKAHRLEERNDAFAVTDAEEGVVKAAVPASLVSRIEIGPRAEIDAGAIRRAAQGDIGVYFLGGRGECVAHCRNPSQTKRDNEMLLLQAEHYLSPEKRSRLAAAFVKGKIHNQRVLLKRLNRNRRLDGVREIADAVKRLAREIDPADSVERLTGCEGRCAKLYWQGLAMLISPEWKFTRRVKRTPTMDPPNILISWISSVLAREMQAILAKSPLHAGIGFLHSPKNMAAPLVYDLIEEFRAPVAESLAVSLMNGGGVGCEDFVPMEDGSYYPQGHVYRTVFVRYEQWMNREIFSSDGRKYSWRRTMERQAARLARHFEGREEYACYRMDY